MKKMIKIAVYGGTQISPEAAESARQVGSLLKKLGITMITGAASGVSQIAAESAHGTEIIGYSPKEEPDEDIRTINEEHLTRVFRCGGYLKEIAGPLELQYTQEAKFKFRNFLSASAADAAIAISGGMGTLTETANCIALGKKVFFMRGTGRYADAASSMFDMIRIDRNLYQDIFSEQELETALRQLMADMYSA